MASEHPRDERRRDQLHGGLQVAFYAALGMLASLVSTLVFNTIPL